MGIFDWLFGKKREARNITNPSDNWDFKEGIKLLRKENVVWQSHNLEQVDVYTLDPHFRLGQAPPDYDIVKGYIGKNNNGKKMQWWECKNYIFKSFEDEKQRTTELNKLLNENNLDINEYEIKNDNKYWNGDDFRIFSPQPINNTKTIIISMLDDSVFEFINKLVDVKINIKKEEIVNQYKRENDLPDTLDTAPGGPKMFKRDMTGLMAYFKEMTNMEKIFNELTGAIRNGYTVKKYLKDANLMDDPEIREIAVRGFNDVAGFLKDMLEINENPELRKDYDACIEAVKILKQN